MTEPRSGPASSSGQSGGSGLPGSGPPADMNPAGMGQGDMSQGEEPEFRADPGSGHAGATASGTAGTEGSGVSTATRTSAGQTTVPQQYGRQSERGMGEAAGRDLGGAGMIALAGRRSWPAVLAGGLGLLAVGVMLFVWPRASLTIVAILIGAGLLVSGLARLYEGFTARSETGGMRAAYVVVGLLAVLAGLYCLRNHALSIFLVAFVTGVYFIAHGISDIGVAISAEVPGRALRGVLGVFSIAAGVLMVVWPGITLVLLFTIAGAFLLFYGLVMCGLAFSIRKAAKDAEAGTARRPPRKLAPSH